MTTSAVRQAAMTCLLLAAVVPPVEAQVGVAHSLEQLASIVVPGTKITLTDDFNDEFSGSIKEVTPTALTVWVDDGAPRVFRESQILRVQERRNDSVMNGVLVGTAIGAGSAAGMTIIAYSANYYIHKDAVVRNVSVWAALGAGAGALVDALRKGRSTVYEKTTSQSSLIGYTVQVTADRKSVLILVRF